MTNVTDEVAKEILSLLKEGHAFVLEQAPALAQEIISFGRASCAFGLAVSVGVLAVSILLFCLCARHGMKSDEAQMFGAVAVIVGVCSTVPLLLNLLELWKTYQAPKLYIYEHLKS